MPTLSIRHGLCGGRATVIATDEWPASGTEAHRWKAIIAGVLVYAFLERRAAVITVPGSPGPAFASLRWGHVAPIRRRPRFPLPAGAYWVGVTASCPEKYLWRVADEDEFELGELWVTAIPGDDLSRADALVRSRPCSDLALPMTAEELVAMDGPSDGRTLVWLNASRPLGEIADAVREIAERRGWTLDSREIVGTAPSVREPAR